MESLTSFELQHVIITFDFDVLCDIFDKKRGYSWPRFVQFACTVNRHHHSLSRLSYCIIVTTHRYHLLQNKPVWYTNILGTKCEEWSQSLHNNLPATHFVYILSFFDKCQKNIDSIRSCITEIKYSQVLFQRRILR